MKNKTISILGGAAVLLSALAAQANTIIDTEASTQNGQGKAGGSYTLTSTVTSITSGVDKGYFEYSYSLTVNSSANPISIDAFTVEGTATGDDLDPNGIIGVSSVSPLFVGGVNDDHVSWTSSSGAGQPQDRTGPETFFFFSPDMPEQGQAFAQDNEQFGPSAAYIPVIPPTVPDGGSTVALLGGALLGLQALRRKLSV